MSDVLAVAPLTRPVDATVRPPGSKSITNRALLCAALADGTSTLSGVLFADDTRAMMSAVGALGATVTLFESDRTVVVRGIDPGTAGGAGTIDARQSGTTSRFLLPAAALLGGRTVVDGSEQLRARPFGPVLGALRQIGAGVEELDRPGFLPAAVTGPAHGGPVEVSGHISSQFLSGLLMAGPLMDRGIDVTLTSPLVSVPYVEMTKAVMAAFGVTVTGLTVPAGAYRPADFAIEPDASAASYFLGAAAITGGRVTVSGLGTGSLQGDVRFADVLERMGASVTRTADAVTVRGGDRLRGIDVDMADISDTAQTLAAVAVFADGPTRVRGIGFIRGKETDRVGAVVTELRRAGIDAVEDPDGFTIHPGAPRPTRFATYDDHRMAMSLSLIGLRAHGIEIADPGCVAKTYPAYFTDLATLG
ncbi:3-phosphoshikimate 1-carboxyvinyltransferase [Actinoplanes campanulatus]|uniref:3-phosphoshikimate 1-carboxyvinyltransferase n=1 Tax=Actinoplanes campanulatus TaxID=113559 RepID=A0A7W5AC25_9ACTN|nr:3-phosphoshikimate 1-carboxyvinyltransferase [Actinoplanes campanulatus]MBB3093538.1 3-phosphoshikimate 1-carboxyvinyltransferase [Actinoplanes campanulatus]GGN04046.1 3-phosphoshikimate 1-carboxyvinyltransferase [Actinoplanes campanulatus]GID35388.1 3-phosphoshikimate 1-carboxyvinyltransferase [Actinoplanes campanulatus]